MTQKTNKIAIDTLIISDIHLGDSGTRCQELMELFNKYDFKKLILNGDILNGLRLSRLHTGHWKILSTMRKLSRNREVIWVLGNHDPNGRFLSQLLGLKVCHKYIWESSGKRFLAIHGHQFDRFLNDNYVLSHLAFAFYTFLKNIDKSGYLTGLIKRRNRTWQRSSLEVAKGALNLAHYHKADYVFCGHTHKLHTAENQGIKYFNTASWNEKPTAYIAITGDKVELIKVD